MPGDKPPQEDAGNLQVTSACCSKTQLHARKRDVPSDSDSHLNL